MPEQLAVLGFNNDPITTIIEPNLSTLINPGFEIGKHAARLIIDHHRLKWTEKDYATIKLETELVVRESSMKNQLTITNADLLNKPGFEALDP